MQELTSLNEIIRLRSCKNSYSIYVKILFINYKCSLVGAR